MAAPGGAASPVRPVLRIPRAGSYAFHRRFRGRLGLPAHRGPASVSCLNEVWPVSPKLDRYRPSTHRRRESRNKASSRTSGSVSEVSVRSCVSNSAPPSPVAQRGSQSSSAASWSAVPSSNATARAASTARRPARSLRASRAAAVSAVTPVSWASRRRRCRTPATPSIRGAVANRRPAAARTAHAGESASAIEQASLRSTASSTAPGSSRPGASVKLRRDNAAAVSLQ